MPNRFRQVFGILQVCYFHAIFRFYSVYLSVNLFPMSGINLPRRKSKWLKQHRICAQMSEFHYWVSYWVLNLMQKRPRRLSPCCGYQFPFQKPLPIFATFSSCSKLCDWEIIYFLLLRHLSGQIFDNSLIVYSSTRNKMKAAGAFTKNINFSFRYVT